MAERFEIAVNPPECLEGAMVYLCLLAYPLAQDDRKRARTFDAFWAYMIREARRHGRLRKGVNRHHSEVLKKMPTQQMWGTLNLANRRIWWRIVAAERFLFWGTMPVTRRGKKYRRPPAEVNRDRFWIQEARLPLPKGFSGGRRHVEGKGLTWFVTEYEFTEERRKPTVTQLVRALAKQIAMPERNVWSQIVRPTRPVLPMADALRSILLEQLELERSESRRDSSTGFDCLRLLRNPDWVKRAVSIAQTTVRYWESEGDWPVLQNLNPREFIELVAKT